MSYPEDKLLNERAVATAWLLKSGLEDLLPGIRGGYEDQYARLLGREPGEGDDSIDNRILFELLGLACYQVMASETEKYCRRSKLLILSEPDPERVRQFNTIFLEEIKSSLEEIIAGLYEIQIIPSNPLQIQEGEPLNFSRRIVEYTKAPKHLADNFSMYFALALDPLNYIHTKILGMETLKLVIEFTQAMTHDIFRQADPLPYASQQILKLSERANV